MKLRHAICCGLAVLASAAQAAAPTVDVITPGVSFGQYAGSAPVGKGQVDSNTLFYIDEQTGPLGKSWYIFFDPQGPGDVTATLSFDAPITGVFSTKADLDASNTTYGNPAITYATSLLIGLERGDTFSTVGNKLTISWHASDPGDHIRVFTSPVPEPETLALMAAGLLALRYTYRRRSNA